MSLIRTCQELVWRYPLGGNLLGMAKSKESASGMFWNELDGESGSLIDWVTVVVKALGAISVNGFGNSRRKEEAGGERCYLTLFFFSHSGVVCVGVDRGL